MSKQIKFKSWNCKLEKTQYRNGRTALELVAFENDEENEIYEGEPIATCTVNIPDIELEADEVCIKNYSENEGMLEILVNAGIVKPTGIYVETGFVSIPICKLM